MLYNILEFLDTLLHKVGLPGTFICKKFDEVFWKEVDDIEHGA